MWCSDAKTELVCPCLVVSCLSLSGIVLLPPIVRALCVQGQTEGVYHKKNWTGLSRPAPALVLFAWAGVDGSSLSILYHCQRRVCLSPLLSGCGTCHALCCAMEGQWTGESSSHLLCPFYWSWRSYEDFFVAVGRNTTKVYHTPGAARPGLSRSASRRVLRRSVVRRRMLSSVRLAVI
jgi:hypothetical protein